MKIQLSLTLLTLLLFAFAGASNAIPVAYSTEADWLNALGASAVIQVEDFESSPLGVYTPGPTDIGSFNVQTDTNDATAAGNDNQIANAGFIDNSREFQAFIIQDGAGGSGADTTFVDFIFESPLAGFAGDYFSAITGDLLIVTVNGTALEFDKFLGGMGTGFFGVVDLMSPITSVRFTVENLTSFGEFWAVDDVRLASIPEPITLALLTLGLFVLGFPKA